MKKINFMLMLCICALAFFNTNEAHAKGEVTFYAKVKAQVSSSSTNMGKVYAGTANSAGTYATPSSTSGELNSGQKESGTSSADVGPFYVFAEPNNGYVFEGWKESDDANADWYSRDNSCSITVTSTNQSEGGYTKTLYAFFAEKKKVTVTMPTTVNGSYSYSCTDGNGTVNTTTSQTIITDAEITFTATPISGYKFFGWYTLDGSTETFLNYSDTYKTTFTTNTTLYAKFIPTTTAVFTLKGTAQYFYDLNTANAAAAASSNKIIVPTINGTIPSGNYTISSGVTLLVPFDAAYTLYTTEPTWPNAAPSGQSAFRKLTLSSGANIVVNGAISVSAQSQGNQPYGGCVHGKYGQIDMAEGSAITIKYGANLYCWGYITGKGSITAKSGASVYEDFQLTCWRGGTAASTMNSGANTYGVFPLAQYYIQNIEAPLTLEAGSHEYTCTAVTALKSVWEATVEIVGTNSGLFRISSGNVTKWYDSVNDKQMYSINGVTALGAVVVDVSVTISSANFVLPLTNNMDITIASGTLTCDQRVAMLPGSRITINKGAKVQLNSNGKIYVYDKDEWKGEYNGSMVSYNYSGNVTHTPAPYSPSCSSIKTLRTFANMNDAEIDINGTLEASGALYTTKGGANIKSSQGTGTIIYKSKAGTETKTYQAFQGGSGGTQVTWHEIPITPAQLHNADGSYTKTSDAPANTTVNYKNGHWGWKVTWKDSDGATLKTEYCYTTPSDSWLTDNKPTNPTKDCKTFSSWSKTTDDAAKQERVYTATYSDKTYAIKYDKGANGTGSIASGTKTCGTDFTLSSITFTRTGYTQIGWSTSDGGGKAFELGGTYSADAAQTFYPFWEANKYTITWENSNGTVLETDNNVPYGTTPTYDGAMPVSPDDDNAYTFPFAGWTPKITSVSEDATYTATYGEKEYKKYLVVWKNWDGKKLYSADKNYGWANPGDYGGVTPTRPTSDGKMYKFIGWSDPVYDVEQCNATITAQYEEVKVLDIPEEETISENTTVETTIVHVSGKLNVSAGTLTTDDLILEATPGTSGEITGEGTIDATNVYFDLTGPFKARTWYAVAVPWQVDVPAYDKENCGVFFTNDGLQYAQQELGKTFDLIYYDGKRRAEQGHSDACWKYIEDDEASKHIMNPGCAYMIYLASDANTIRFKKKAGASIHTNSLNVYTYSGNGNGKDANWNGIANPATFHAYLNAHAYDNTYGENVGQVYDAETRSYKQFKMDENQLVAGQPIYVQVQGEQEQNVLANQTSYSANPASAPRRAKAYTEMQRLEVTLASEDKAQTDRIVIRTMEDKEDTYTIGQDLVKMGTSDIVPQMWVDRYDSRLCINTVAPVNDVATYPLSLFAPKADEYTVSTNATAEDNVTLYLTFDGRPIWNLTYSPYVTSLEKGTNRHYGLMLIRSKAPEVATGMGEVQDGTQPAAQKILLNGQVYILRGGELYSITGQSVK